MKKTRIDPRLRAFLGRKYRWIAGGTRAGADNICEGTVIGLIPIGKPLRKTYPAAVFGWKAYHADVSTRWDRAVLRSDTGRYFVVMVNKLTFDVMLHAPVTQVNVQATVTLKPKRKLLRRPG